MDLAKAHVDAVRNFNKVFVASPKKADTHPNFRVINLGTGKGCTVRELVTIVEQVTGEKLAPLVTSRRPGDVAGSFANADAARRLINWRAELNLKEAVQSALAWSKKYFA